MKFPIRLLIALALFLLPFSAKATLYTFYQSGFNGGGFLSGTMIINDVNQDGMITYNPGAGQTSEVTFFLASLHGNTVIDEGLFWSSTLSDTLLSLSYSLDTPFLSLGTGESLNMERVSSSGHIIQYTTGASVFVMQDATTSATISTTNPIMISTSPIDEVTYETALQTVPEPSSLALLLGAIPAAMWWRRCRKAVGNC